MPVKLPNGIADKTTTKLTYTRGVWVSKLAAKEVLHGETEPKQLSVVEVYWNSIRINIGLIEKLWFLHEMNVKQSFDQFLVL